MACERAIKRVGSLRVEDDLIADFHTSQPATPRTHNLGLLDDGGPHPLALRRLQHRLDQALRDAEARDLLPVAAPAGQGRLLGGLRLEELRGGGVEVVLEPACMRAAPAAQSIGSDPTE